MNEDIHPKMYMYRRIVEAKLFIDQNYAQKIDLEHISSEAHFSKFHFLRLFKQAYGTSPHKYLTEVRIKHAKALLQAQHSVTDTCFAVGFESLSSFTELFKRHTGHSPSAFALQCKQKQAAQSESPLQFVPNCFSETFNWNK